MKTYKTKMSSQGQVVIPAKIREEAKLKSGDRFSVAIYGQNIVLTPHSVNQMQEAESSDEGIDGNDEKASDLS